MLVLVDVVGATGNATVVEPCATMETWLAETLARNDLAACLAMATVLCLLLLFFFLFVSRRMSLRGKPGGMTALLMVMMMIVMIVVHIASTCLQAPFTSCY